jgi:hypothetical protein
MKTDFKVKINPDYFEEIAQLNEGILPGFELSLANIL